MEMEFGLKNLVKLKSELNELVDKANALRDAIKIQESELSCKAVMTMKDTYHFTAKPTRFYCTLMKGHKGVHMISWGVYAIEFNEDDSE